MAKDINFKSKSLVSIVIPAFNCANTITETLNSILVQDYPMLEIIVINDGSTDNTLEVLKNYGDKIILLNQENSGSAVSRSQGVRRATGKYIAFIDADDLWVPWKISAQIKYLETHPDVGMVYNKWLLIDDQADTPRLPIKKPDEDLLLEIDEQKSGYLYTQLLMECIVHTSSVVVLRDICLQVGDFDSSLRRGQDYDYWLRISRMTKIVKLKAVLSAYRIHDASITHQIPVVNYEAQLLSKTILKYGLVDQNGNQLHFRTANRRLAESWIKYCWLNYHGAYYKRTVIGALNVIRYCPFRVAAWRYLLGALGHLVIQSVTCFKCKKSDG